MNGFGLLVVAVDVGADADAGAVGKLDRKRTQRGSNEEWVDPHDPEARITAALASRAFGILREKQMPTDLAADRSFEDVDGLV